MIASVPSTPGWRSRGAALALIAALLCSGAAMPAAGAARHRTGARAFQQFSNTASITIPNDAMAAPSVIQVSGLGTPIADVDVSLNVLIHPNASDLDVLLVGPGGQSALVLSDVGDEANNDSLTFSDQAVNQVGIADPLVSGTFQPTNVDLTSAPDIFGPPGPANPPGGSALAIFNGTDANGAWTLLIREQDANPVESGSLAAGWSLRITTASGVPETNGEQFRTKAGKTLTVPASGVLANDSDPDGDPLTAILASPTRKGALSLQPDGSFTYKAKKKARGRDSFTYLARDSTGLSALETVTIQIKGKKRKR